MPAQGTAPEAADRAGLQKINVKLLLELPPGFDHDVLLGIFGRWRLDPGEEILDLADYGHVEDGPGCLMLSHRWQFGIDHAGGVPGLFYATRKGLSGDLAERLAQAIAGFLAKAQRLAAEPTFPRGVVLRCGELEVTLNDRLQAPNTDAMDATVRPALDQVLRRLYGSSDVRVEREKDPSRRLGYRVHAPASGLSLAELARRLA